MSSSALDPLFDEPHRERSPMTAPTINRLRVAEVIGETADARSVVFALEPHQKEQFSYDRTERRGDRGAGADLPRLMTTTAPIPSDPEVTP
jgi:hypothetical protein